MPSSSGQGLEIVVGRIPVPVCDDGSPFKTSPGKSSSLWMMRIKLIIECDKINRGIPWALRGVTFPSRWRRRWVPVRNNNLCWENSKKSIISRIKRQELKWMRKKITFRHPCYSPPNLAPDLHHRLGAGLYPLADHWAAFKQCLYFIWADRVYDMQTTKEGGKKIVTCTHKDRLSSSPPYPHLRHPLFLCLPWP